MKNILVKARSSARDGYVFFNDKTNITIPQAQLLNVLKKFNELNQRIEI